MQALTRVKKAGEANAEGESAIFSFSLDSGGITD